MMIFLDSRTKNREGFTPYETDRPKAVEALPAAGRLHTGFTLVELIVAMALFSFMLILISVGVLQTMRLYRTDLAARRTQESARLAMSELSREVRASASIEEATTNCLRLGGGSSSVFFIRDLSNNRLNKVVGNGTCASYNEISKLAIIDGNKTQAREFINEAINDASGEAVSVKVVLTVVSLPRSGDDLLQNNRCKTGPGAEFCSSTTYTNIVSLRGSQ